MKKTFGRRFVILLAAAILFSFPFHIRADEETMNYSELFAHTLTTDGAYSEILSDDIGYAFDQSPIGFLNALVAENNTVQNNVIMLLVYNQYVRGGESCSVFCNTLLCITVDDTIQDDIRALVNRILEEMNSFLTIGSEKYPSSEDVIVDAEYAFDKDTIKKFIQLNLALKNTDEEFFHTISQAYQTGPVAFASLVSEYSETDIMYLAKGISYDFHKAGITSVAVNKYSGNDDVVSNAFGIILDQIFTVDNSKLIEELVSVEALAAMDTPTLDLRSGSGVSIGTMSYTSGNLIVGESERLSVTLSENQNTLSSRSYLVKVYQKIGSTKTLKATKSAIIPPGVTSLPVYIDMTFTDTSSFYTYVEVYSASGGTLYTSRTGLNPDIVYGYWKINVILPVNRDYKGRLYLYRANGSLSSATDCLGKSVYNISSSFENGDTPTGEYTGYLYGPISSDTAAYGPYKVVAMTGVSGQIVTSGRNGIWIHGGREGVSNSDDSWYPLYPTYGCVRISNRDQLTIQNAITGMINNYYHFTTGNIFISEGG